MCELLGISVDPAARMGLYLWAFRRRASDNFSGWGAAWWEGSRSRLVKETQRADHSVRAADLAQRPPTSSLFLVHVRAATVGPVSLANTHPFAERVHGRDWAFAHNGTIHHLDGLDTGGRRPLGETDSEIAFHHTMACIEALGPDPGADAVASAVRYVAAELSQRGEANFLLADGTTLFAYYDGHKSLHYTQREGRDLGRLRVSDHDYTIDLEVLDAPRERAVIVASVPLTEEVWTPMEPGSLLVCSRGACELLAAAR